MRAMIFPSLLWLLAFQVPGSKGENISVGKLAKQRSTYIYSTTHFGAEKALDRDYIDTGSLTNHHGVSWWELDLMGYYIVENITLTMANSNSWETHTRNANVGLMDRDIELCPDVQVLWCGNVSAAPAKREEFTFSCDASFPVRFVRIWRTRDNNDVRLGLGHVEVHGKGTIKPYRSFYTSTMNKKPTELLKTTSALSAAECGILCHQLHSCLHFSFSKTAPSDANCLMTNYPTDQSTFTSTEPSWVLYRLEDCK